jgi:hypothetical protein
MSRGAASHTRLCVAAVVIVVLAIAACTGSSEESGWQPPTEMPGTASPTEAEVLAAVTAAETATVLPPSINPMRLVKSAEDVRGNWGLPGCVARYEVVKLDNITPCTVGAPTGAHTMVVIGDSNALMWADSLGLIGERLNWRVIILAKDDCGPAELTYYQWHFKRDFTECDAWRKWRTDQITSIRPSVVVLAGWYGGNTGPDRPLTPEVWRDGLIKTINQFSKGTKVALLGNQPHITISPGECLAAHTSEISKCAADASSVVPSDANGAIEQAANATSALYVDIIPWFCAKTCPQVIAEQIVYSGARHITRAYGRYLSVALAGALQPVMN